MAITKRKFYVVWEGRAPGVYDSWEECEAQISGYPGARYKGFGSQADAVAAFRGDGSNELELFRLIGSKTRDIVNYSAFPEIRLDAIAVDGACAKNPGPMEYRGVSVATGEEIFHMGPLAGGTNNIGEYIALIHAASLLARRPHYANLHRLAHSTVMGAPRQIQHNGQTDGRECKSDRIVAPRRRMACRKQDS